MKYKAALSLLLLACASIGCEAFPRSQMSQPKPPSRTTVATTALTTEPLRELTIEEKIDLANKNVTDLSSLNEDFQMTIGSNFNWEDLLSPAPLGIGILGDLMVMASSMSDFPLNEVVAEGGYKYMMYPGSFRASLVQISNGGYHAFSKANTNMDKIRLYALTVPTYMKDATRTLLTKKPKLITKFLPIPLKRIQESAEKSVTLSLEVVQAFDHVMNLTGEVLTAVTATKGLKEVQLDDVRKEKELLIIVVTNTATMLEDMKKEKERLEKSVEESQNDIREAISKMPSGWDKVGMDIVEGLRDFVTFQFERAITGGSGTVGPSGSTADNTAKTVSLEDECLINNRQNILHILGIADNLNKFAIRNFTSANPTRKTQFNAKKDLDILSKIAKKAVGCGKLESVCEDGGQILENLEELLKSDAQFNETDEITEKIEDLLTQAEALKNKVQTLGIPSSSLPSPSRSHFAKTDRTSDKMIAEVRNQVDMAQERFRINRESADKARDRMVKINKEYIDALSRMQNTSFSEIRYEEAVKLLQQGLVNLAKLKEHWSKLVRYFKSVSNIVEVVMSRSLVDFQSYVNETSTDLDLLTADFTLEMIYESAMKASQASYFVHSMADTYTKVSSKYIMPNVAKLDQLIAFDPKSANMSIDEKRNELLESCTRDSEEIVNLIMQDKNALIGRIERRMQNIRDQYAFLFNPEELEQLQSENYILEESPSIA